MAKEYELFKSIIEGVIDAANQGSAVFAQWKQKRPDSPIPPMLPHAEARSGVPITPDGYDALRQWSSRLLHENATVRRLVSYDDWLDFVFRKFLAVYQDVADGYESDLYEDDAVFNGSVKNELIELLQIEYEVERFHLFPASYALDILLERHSFGPVVFVPPGQVIEEVDWIYKDASSSVVNELREKTKQELERLSSKVTCFVRVDMKGAAPKRSASWARAAARLSILGATLPFGLDAIGRSGLIDENSMPLRQHTSLSFRKDRVSAPSWWMRPPSIKNGNALIPTEDTANEEAREDFGRLLQVLLDVEEKEPRDWACPVLGKIWLSALHWFYRGVLADMDSEAVVYVGSALDILVQAQAGGSKKAIHETVAGLLNTSTQSRILAGPEDLTLKQVVENLYNSGRSRIIHGSKDLFREDFTITRRSGQALVWVLLLEYWERLSRYEKERRSDGIGSFVDWVDEDHRIGTK